MEVCRGEEALSHGLYPYVNEGYRRHPPEALTPYLDCFKSAFMWHVETFNIWSIIGWCVYLGWAVWRSPRLVGLWFLGLAGWLHMPFAVGNHLFIPVSEAVSMLWRKLDLYGIFIGSVVISVGVCWHAFPLLAWLPLVMAVGVVAYVNCQRVYKSVELVYPNVESVVWVGVIMALYTLPVVFYAFVDSRVRWLLLGVVLVCVMSGLVMVYEWPQKYIPGMVFGISHHWMHVGVFGMQLLYVCIVNVLGGKVN